MRSESTLERESQLNSLKITTSRKSRTTTCSSSFVTKILESQHSTIPRFTQRDAGFQEDSNGSVLERKLQDLGRQTDLP
jgi:hypothetical protein